MGRWQDEVTNRYDGRIPLGASQVTNPLNQRWKSCFLMIASDPLELSSKEMAPAPFRGCRGHSIAPLALSAFPLQIYTVGDHLRIKKSIKYC